MANHDIVCVYDEEFAEWLTEEGYTHPPVLDGNRTPSTADVMAVLAEIGDLVLDYPDGLEEFCMYREGQDGIGACIDGFDWSDDTFEPESFAIRGSVELQMTILTALSQRCGQLLCYPDSGDPAIIYPTRLDPVTLAAFYAEAEGKEDSWEIVFEHLYGEGSAQLDDDDGDWYGVAMQVREEALKAKFGPTFPSDMVTAPEDVTWDMKIPGFAFLRFAPNLDRPYWLWLTHGLSQPFQDKGLPQDRTSRTGYGVEFAIATVGDESWPVSLLETVSAYRFGNSRPVFPGDRLSSSDLMYEESGGHVLVMENPGYETTVETGLYTFQILHLVGTTASEIARAKRYSGRTGSQILECALRHYGIGCVTDRNRSTITQRSDFETIWRDCGGNSSNETEPPRKKKWFWQR